MGCFTAHPAQYIQPKHYCYYILVNTLEHLQRPLQKLQQGDMKICRHPLYPLINSPPPPTTYPIEHQVSALASLLSIECR